MSRRRPAAASAANLCTALLAALLPGGLAAQGFVAPKNKLPGAPGTVVWQPTLIPGTCARPEYPLNSIRGKEQGTSAITLTVGAGGSVRETAVLTSSGSARLDQAAADGMAACRFKPAQDSTGAPMQSSYVMRHEWRLEDAPPDPWVELKALNGAGFSASGDVAALAVAGDSAASPAQRAKVLAMVKARATEMAGCPSIEAAASRIVRSAGTPEGADRRSLELWTLTQCGRTMRYGIVVFFPADRPPFFRARPFAASEPDPT
ncbi:energy transducer TonB [Acidovorax sp. GBBC 3334]|uniref:TonB family protein n=1 Tax=Acidovorax sp. GBBC 3334 TaxID=2940496 RepID=UPI0023048044|nr:TonB family protein [Acidovorax sp. GBBC 3334]MDA8455028.1 energy transducer TonB [Acidovorax sp. GBBC 3334]